MFIVALGILCNSNFQFYLRTSRCSDRSADTLSPIIFLNGHNIRPTFCLPSDRFRVSTGTSWVMVPGMYRTHYKHNLLILSSAFNNKLSLVINGCMWVETLGHIPRYMGRTSSNNNNNKRLINNLLYCFVIRIVCIQITITWDIRYIDEGFLVWIILSTYLSHEIVIWVVPLVLPYFLSSDFIWISGFIINIIVIILYIFIS